MKTTDKPISAAPRLISRCVWSALALLGAADAAANKQFANVPFYLDSKSESSAVKVKPNVMFLIDDSGSMTYPVLDEKNRNIGTRIAVTKTALKAILAEHKDTMNWGLQTLNKSVKTDGYTTKYQDVSALVDKIVANGATPTTRRYLEVSKDVRDQTEYRCQKNYIVLMSDGEANFGCDWSNQSIRPVNLRSNSYNALMPQSTWTYEGYESLHYPEGASAEDVAYFGQPVGREANYCYVGSEWGNGPYNTFFDRNDGLRFFSGTLLSKDFKTSGRDKAKKGWNGEDDTGEFKTRYAKQTVETFTVGFGLKDSVEGTKYLQRGAAVSGSQGFFEATSAKDLVESFGKIFSTIDAANGPVAISTRGTTAPALSNPGQATSAGVVDVDSGSWSSRLKFYQINADGTVNAAFSEPSFSNRQTILNDGKTNYLVVNLTDTDKTNADFGISGGTPSDQLEWKNTLLPWTVRKSDDTTLKTAAANKKYSQPYRVRETTPTDKRNLGDILDSPLLTIGNQVNGRNEFLVTAANDGMVHLFRSQEGTNPYDLKISYIPAGMERDDDGGSASTMGKYLKDVAHEKYGTTVPHRYLINGGIVVRQTAKSTDSSKTDQRSLMFGAMGQGGRGAYALNIGGKDRADNTGVGLDATSALSGVPLFETEKGENNKLGYTVGTPQIGRVSIQRGSDGAVSLTENVRYAGFLASGYRVKGTVEGKTNETALYVYDMLGQEADSGKKGGAAAGSLIRKIEVSDGVGGLSSPTLVDTDFDGVIDVAYAGDYGGNMYRFDLRAEKPADWKVSRIYVGDSKQPITAAPAISRRVANKYVVIFGTGSDIYADDRDNTDQQAVYGIFDDLSVTSPAAAEADKLLVQTLSSGKVTVADPDDSTKTIQTDAYTLSNNKITKEHKGWKINLAAGGERVVVKPTMILRTAVITTRSYKVETKTTSTNGDVCIPEVTTTGTTSSTMMLGINAENGGQPTKRNGYVQFIKDTTSAQAYAYAGLRQPGIISFTYMDTSKVNDSPVTRDGDSGGSGTDQPFKAANSEIPNNKCFGRKATRVLLTNKNASYNIEGRICGIHRLSWREIFF